MTDVLHDEFNRLIAAYQRGIEWGRANGSTEAEAYKAAYDYADKASGPPALSLPITAEPGEADAMMGRIVDALNMAHPHTLQFDAESGGYYDTDLSREISALLGAIPHGVATTNDEAFNSTLTGKE